jgi:hypothetical protein
MIHSVDKIFNFCEWLGSKYIERGLKYQAIENWRGGRVA